MVVRIALNILRLAVLVNLVLGILFWTGNADILQNVHMLKACIRKGDGRPSLSHRYGPLRASVSSTQRASFFFEQDCP